MHLLDRRAVLFLALVTLLSVAPGALRAQEEIQIEGISDDTPVSAPAPAVSRGVGTARTRKSGGPLIQIAPKRPVERPPEAPDAPVRQTKRQGRAIKSNPQIARPVADPDSRPNVARVTPATQAPVQVATPPEPVRQPPETTLAIARTQETARNKDEDEAANSASRKAEIAAAEARKQERLRKAAADNAEKERKRAEEDRRDKERIDKERQEAIAKAAKEKDAKKLAELNARLKADDAEYEKRRKAIEEQRKNEDELEKAARAKAWEEADRIEAAKRVEKWKQMDAEDLARREAVQRKFDEDEKKRRAEQIARREADAQKLVEDALKADRDVFLKFAEVVAAKSDVADPGLE